MFCVLSHICPLHILTFPQVCCDVTLCHIGWVGGPGGLLQKYLPPVLVETLIRVTVHTAPKRRHENTGVPNTSGEDGKQDSFYEVLDLCRACHCRNEGQRA